MDETAFQILEHNGFLPTHIPLDTLPPKYVELENILNKMPIKLANGEPGLLGKGLLGDTLKSFPLLVVSDETDIKIITALFRDYSFLASAYIFEPCHNDSGLPPRSVLPKNLSVPLTNLGVKLGIRPFLDYAHSYILYNWKKKDQDGGMEIENLDVIRSFTGSRSERGFVLVTVGVNAHSASLVKFSRAYLTAVEENDNHGCADAMRNLLETMKLIYAALGRMWTQSHHADFKFIRNFINGTTDHKLFPNGLVFENDEETVRSYRGVSAAADSMIPLMDAILELTPAMPESELKKTLQGFRSYRPILHQQFLEWAEMKSKSLGTRNFGIQTNPLIFLQILDQVRQFRTRHWRFIKMYIIRHSSSGGGLGSGGGSLNLLPNVLTVLHEMDKIVRLMEESQGKLSSEEELVFKKLSETTKKELEEVEIEAKALEGTAQC